MFVILAEKMDVGSKIAAALSGFDVDGVKITSKNVDKMKEKIEAKYKKRGYLELNYFGDTGYVTWAQGHLCTLKQAKDYNPEYSLWSNLPIPFFPDNFEIKVKEGYNFKEKKPSGCADVFATRQLGIIGDLCEKSDYIINATDYDREGELIFSYIYEYLNLNKPYKRVLLQSQTQEGFIEAFNNLLDSSEAYNIEQAGRGRNIADWVVGANLTALMTIKYSSGKGGLISVGRVQTPALNILVKREKEILNFKSHPFWNIKALFKTDNGTYIGKYDGDNFEKKDDAENILKKINGQSGTVISKEIKTVKKDVPFLYNLTALSMDANNKYGLTANQTLDIAQELYSSGYITYPRTKSICLTDDMRPFVDNVLDMLLTFPEYENIINSVQKNQRNYTKRHFDSSKVESHFAIIPTNVKPDVLSENQKKVYDMIARSLIRIIFKEATLEKTKIITEVCGEKFNTNGNVVKDAQWMILNDKSKNPKAENDDSKEDDESDGDETILPPVNKGDIVDGKYELTTGKTTPPSRYTDASFLRALKTAGKEIEEKEMKKVLYELCDGGIGTEATRPAIIETVIARYCTRKGKSIIPTQKGIDFIDILPIDEVKSPELTANFELQLLDVEHGKGTLDDFINSIKESTQKWVDKIKNSTTTRQIYSGTNNNETKFRCPVCGNPLIKYKWGWGCKNYSKEGNGCNFAIKNEILGVSISDTILKHLLERRTTELIYDFHGKENKIFNACLHLNEENKIELTRNSGFTCPKCGKPVVYGKNNLFCSGYKDGCDFSFWYGEKNIQFTDLISLFEKGKTRLISGFKSKKGTDFAAHLKFDNDYKVVFEFEKSNSNNTKKEGKK